MLTNLANNYNNTIIKNNYNIIIFFYLINHNHLYLIINMNKFKHILLMYNILPKTYLIKVKKNVNWSLNFFNSKRFYIKSNFLLFKKKFKLTTLLYFFKKWTLKKKKNFKNTFFYPTYFFLLKFPCKNNSIFLTGGLLSPFYWEFLNQKPWIDQKLKFSLVNNQDLIEHSTNRFTISDASKFNSRLFKKLYTENLFYFFNLDTNYNDLKYLLKAASTKTIPHTANWMISRPYLFLNNFKLNNRSYYFSNSMVLAIFKSYISLFKNAKKIKTYNKSFNKFYFKFSHSETLLHKNFTNIYLTKQHLANTKAANICFLAKTPLLTNVTIKKYPQLDLQEKNFLFYPRGYFARKFSYLQFVRKSQLLFYLYHRFRRVYFKDFTYFKNFFLTDCSMTNFDFLKSQHRAIVFNSDNPKTKQNFFKKIKKLFFISLYYDSVAFEDCFEYVLNSDYPINNHYSTNLKTPYSYSWNPQFNFFLKNSLYTFLRIVNNNLSLVNITSKFLIDSHRFFFFKHPVIFQKYRANFVGNFKSFLHLSHSSLLSQFQKKTNSTHLIKKTLYSFSLKNELHKFILRRYVRSRITSFFYKNNTIFAKSANFIGNIFQNFNKPLFSNLIDSLKSLTNADFFIHKKLSTKKWIPANKMIDYTLMIRKEGDDLMIKRVKFKPGYMVIWRAARSVLKETMNLNFRYQHRLTSYLSKYRKFSNFRFYMNLEMQLTNVLIKSRLLHDQFSVDLFLDSGLVYVNGQFCNDAKFQIYKGDFIQFIISAKYYILSRWLLSWIAKKRIRLRNKARFKLSPQGRIFGDEKQKSYLLPKWVLYSRHLIEDTARYLEIDFFTLSIFVIYEPFMWSDTDPYSILGIRYSVINLYNWKYIN